MVCFGFFSGDQGDTILVVTITALSHKTQSSIWLLCSRKKWQYDIWKPSWRNLKANSKKGKPHFRNQSEIFIWEHLGVGILSGFTHFLINEVSIKKFEIQLVWLGCLQYFRFQSVLRGCKMMNLFINITLFHSWNFHNKILLKDNFLQVWFRLRPFIHRTVSTCQHVLP